MSASTAELVDSIGKFLRRYYDKEIKQLAQKYPNEQRSLYVDWDDIYQYNDRERDINTLAEDILENPEQMQRYFEEALRQYYLPIDISLENAHVRFTNLPDAESYNIGELSPSRKDGNLIALQGQIAKKTKVAPIPTEIAYECQLCGTINRVPAANGFDEPHECKGCERQG
ncbi:XRE family transcriptional regulator, partial [Halobiforma nitratireducens JCM 10879]